MIDRYEFEAVPEGMGECNGVEPVITDGGDYVLFSEYLALKKQLNDSKGCTNHYCYLTGKREGVGTNAGCTCLQRVPTGTRLAVMRRIRVLEDEIKRLKGEVDV